jgi:hypothetical protein
VTGSGTVFPCGIAVGSVALFGLWLLLAGAPHTSRPSRAARRGLKQSRRETAQSRQETAAVAKDRDELIGQRDTARAYTASTLSNGASSAGLNASQDDARSRSPPGADPAPQAGVLGLCRRAGCGLRTVTTPDLVPACSASGLVPGRPGPPVQAARRPGRALLGLDLDRRSGG